jgi:hypothetical protein
MQLTFFVKWISKQKVTFLVNVIRLSQKLKEILYDITGQWSGELFIKKHNPNEKTSTVGGLLVIYLFFIGRRNLY